jgi:hypothetical protein
MQVDMHFNPKDLLDDGAATIMFNFVMCCLPTSQPTSIVGLASLLVSACRAPAVPKESPDGGTDPRRNKARELLKIPVDPP